MQSDILTMLPVKQDNSDFLFEKTIVYSFPIRNTRHPRAGGDPVGKQERRETAHI
jgi:hypothetical protein